MKIVCQSCGAKYAIADDKVKGKVFKIRCKKCNEAIVVKGTDEEAGATGSMGPPEVEEENEAATKVFDYSSYTVGSGGDPNAMWHVVVEGEQRGPFTMEQLRHFQEAGTVTAETYVWREGFGEWKPIRDVPDFGKPGAAASPMAAPIAPAAAESLFAAEPQPLSGDGLFEHAAPAGGGLFDAGGGGLFGGGGGSAAKQDSPFSAGGGLFSSSPATHQGDVFSSAGASAGKEDLFKALDTPGPSFGGPEAMTGARNESSVLFSLSNLQALASSPQPTVKGGGGAATTVPSSSEASGLIDIRSLAGALADDGKKDSGMDDFMSFGGGGFAPALGAPVLTATRGGGISTGLLIGLIAGGVVLLAVLVVGGIALFAGDSDKEPSADVALLLAKIEKLEKSGASEEEKAKAREELASAQTAVAEPGSTSPKGETGDKASATAKKDDKQAKTSSDRSTAARKQGDSGTKTTRAGSGSESPSPASSSPAPTSGTGKSGKASSELDELLGGGGAPAAAKKPAAAKPEPSTGGGGGGGSEMLTREQVQAGLNAVAPAVKRCAQGQTGTITVQVVISPAGRVSSATPTGSFAGTPIGSCAARAAQGARFPKSSKELTVRFPFKL